MILTWFQLNSKSRMDWANLFFSFLRLTIALLALIKTLFLSNFLCSSGLSCVLCLISLEGLKLFQNLINFFTVFKQKGIQKAKLFEITGSGLFFLAGLSVLFNMYDFTNLIFLGIGLAGKVIGSSLAARKTGNCFFTQKKKLFLTRSKWFQSRLCS